MEDEILDEQIYEISHSSRKYTFSSAVIAVIATSAIAYFYLKSTAVVSVSEASTISGLEVLALSIWLIGGPLGLMMLYLAKKAKEPTAILWWVVFATNLIYVLFAIPSFYFVWKGFNDVSSML